LRQKELAAQKRVDLRREQLIAQYTRMEEAMSKLNAQSSSLLSSLNGLKNNS
jgi:flagellar hook-associated protein 2